MFKSVIAGFLLGIVATAAALYYVPVVDQVRERSLIEVTPNGGNAEVFHVNVPIDRIMIGAPDQQTPVPAGLQWPLDPRLQDIRAEVFKIRNSKDAVVGVASRIAANDPGGAAVIEWTLHLPARGSVYVAMQPQALEGGFRRGELRSGTRDFAALRGQVIERWVAYTGEDEVNAGRIEIITAFTASAGAAQ